ncbi:MAG TPA: methyltransferase domain-containing protein [Candidatus Desulfofervidus auxilii]|uniref:Methyltransferase domain-containing protein n=1 Tax=Desulfofervidus auxilii TaxID=1621989 RepID=A0A7C0U4A5_DESA2|nr:N-6 DNA methylase [Candidatus Baldrarchaeota archaeon]HDD45434.1 methyltransferase domain-containing protein [Candidatus Desulfofervidus auxilii]
MVNETLHVIRKMKKKLSEEDARLFFHKLVSKVADKIGVTLPYTLDVKDYSSVKIKEKLNQLVQQVIDNPDIIDDIYNILIPRKYRRKYGQFFTPPNIAEFMVTWGLSEGGKNVLDPGVGTGIFLSKAFSLLKKKKDFRLTGIDIDPILLNACFIRLKLLGVDINNLTLIKGDFLSWESEDKYDFVVCNPPYIKFHGFDRNIVIRIAREFGIQITRLTNIYTLFFVQTSKFIKDGGRIAFITPSEFLYTGYGQELKKFLIENFKIEAFILVGLEKEVFENVMTTGLITLLKKEKPEREHQVKFIRLDDNYQQSLENLESLKYITKIHQHQLDPKEKWLTYFVKNNNFGNILHKLIPLSTIATVDRGIATGYNAFFTLSEQTIKKFSIPRQYLKSVVAKASHCPHYDFTSKDWDMLRKKGENVFLLYCFSKQPPESLKAYLEYGLKLGVNRRYIPSHRKIWYMVDKRKPAPILALVFSRERMRFVFNKAKVLNLTPFHCIYPLFNDELKLKALLAYLNSNICKEIATYYGRIYGTGLRKLEPKDLENLPVIDVKNISQDDIKRLANLFDKLCMISRQDPKKENEVKKIIDATIKDILSRFRFKRQEFLDEFFI